jgi:hypothetical protein
MILTVPRVSIVFLMPFMGVALAFAEGVPNQKNQAPSKPKIDVSLPTFDSIPKAEGLKKGEQPEAAQLAGQVREAKYQVVRIQHARAFVRKGAGSTPVGSELKAISLSGRPLLTEKFTTLVRVKSAGKVAAPIDVSVVDNLGDPVFSASGQLSYRGTRTDEVDYLVDWDPTPVRAPGDFRVLVRVAGELIGSYPLPAVEAKN